MKCSGEPNLGSEKCYFLELSLKIKKSCLDVYPRSFDRLPPLTPGMHREMNINKNFENFS